jgi:crotonobetainyl-CoA:carnitine CoA-transferase CaiB-like acyl-CoA transferase
VSLLAAAISSLANQATNYLVAGQVPMRMGSEHPNIVPYGTVVRTADARELVLAVGTERQWRQLTDALSRADLAADPRFATNQARVRHRGELGAVLDAVFWSMAADDVAARLTAAKVPFGFVNDMAAVFEQPESERLVMMADGLRGVRTFVADGFGEACTLTPPPSFNGDGRRVLTQRLGLDDAELALLRDSGAWPG